MITSQPIDEQEHETEVEALDEAFSSDSVPNTLLSLVKRFGLTTEFVLLLAIIVATIGCAITALLYPEQRDSVITVLLLLSVTTLLTLFFAARQLRKTLVEPMQRVHNWAFGIAHGNLDNRLPDFECGGCNELSNNVNRVSDALQKLTHDMDDEVQKNMHYIEQKTRSLEILYDVAASINISRDLNDLLIRFLHTLKDLTKARAAAVRLLTNDQHMNLIYSIGLDEKVVEQEQMIPLQRCMCGKVATEGEVMCQEDISTCGEYAGQAFFTDEDVQMLAVPLQYRGRTLGVYNLFVDKSVLDDLEDTNALLTSIGRHLGMAIEKAHIDNEAKKLSIIQERTMLAHELHDSLAQTLASLRFQVRVLDETLQQSADFEAIQEIEQIENSLDEAYLELRELIAHFRAPIGQRGLIPSLEKIIKRFRDDTGIATFLQKEWQHASLPTNYEMQVLRIIQECLANIRKHSEAHAVRVILRCDAAGNYMVLVEDDGVGFDKPILDGHPGEHVGLSIMEERAQHLGGRVRIESEPGDGTRIQLTFRFNEGVQVEIPELQVMT